MLWSRKGAQFLLNVRTAHLNGRLERYTGRLKPMATNRSDTNSASIAA
jgi:hypothetical protein